MHGSQGKKIFALFITQKLEKNQFEDVKNSFYLVFLVIFYYSVISDSAGHLAIEFIMSGTYIIILEKKIFGQIKFNFTT